MRRLAAGLAGVAAALALALPAAAAAPAAGAAQAAGSRYVVVYKRSVGSAEAQTSALQGRLRFASDFRYASALKGFAATLTPGQVRALAHDPSVAYVEPDVTFTIAGTVAPVAGETVPVGIRRIGAATATAVGSASGVGVAELDTGINLGASDLNACAGSTG